MHFTPNAVAVGVMACGFMHTHMHTCPRANTPTHVLTLPNSLTPFPCLARPPAPPLQAVLHVHKPHYMHMFDQVFSGPKPWVFGHLYLPGGSNNLGRYDVVEAHRLHNPSLNTVIAQSTAPPIAPSDIHRSTQPNPSQRFLHITLPSQTILPPPHGL